MSYGTMEEAREILKRDFGHTSFRSGQDEVIASILDGRDTLVVMPTGGGKSLCYQVPALIREGVTIVVSPLIALMKDQVDTLIRRSVRATFINSALDYREAMERMEKAQRGFYKLLYVSPERFESMSFLERIRDVRVTLFAVDEAHCISEWGHDFRPSYKKLAAAVQHLGLPQIVALTATATPEVRRDIEHSLTMREPKIFVRGFDRPNLSLEVLTGLNKKDFILQRCLKGDAGIVYVGTRKLVEETTLFLRRHKISAAGYHAGMDEKERKQVQEAYTAGEIIVIVATTAFGMGIDKPDVRFVVHHDIPGSVEQYYQEAGRAGRDGLPSTCTLLFHPKDLSLPEFFIRNAAPSKELIQKIYAVLHQAAGNPVGSTHRELVRLSPVAIANLAGGTNEVAVQSALNLLEASGYLRKVHASYAQARIRFLNGPEETRQWLLESAPDMIAPVALGLLRTVGGEAFFHSVSFDVGEAAEKMYLSEEVVLNGLRELRRHGIIEYDPGMRGSGYMLLGDRIPSRSLKLEMKRVTRRMRHQLDKLRVMHQYVRSRGCRRNQILEYFAEEDILGTCGRCDNCRSGEGAWMHGIAEEALEQHRKRILWCVAELDGKFGRTTVADVLRGARTKKISQYKLYETTSFGKAAHIDRTLLIEWIDSLIALGHLGRTDSLHPAVYITAAGRAMLDVAVRPFVPPRPSDREEEEVPDPLLYESLRTARRRIARKYNMSSHAVCPDSVLRNLCNRIPGSKEEFLEIPGVGLTTYDRCGKEFLRVIEEHGTESRLVKTLESSREVFPALSSSTKKTFELCALGLSLAEIAEHRSLTEGTVSQHISEMISKGVPVNTEQFVSPEHQAKIRKALSLMKRPDFRRLREILGEEIGYAEIRIMVAVETRNRTMGGA